MSDQAKLKAEAAKTRAEVHAKVAAARTPDGGSYEVGADGKRTLAQAATKDYVHDAAAHRRAVEAQAAEIAAAQAEADSRAAAATAPAPAAAAAEAAVSTDANTSNTGKKR